MKFCYADESGHGSEILVVAGVIVDATRMQPTKAAWNRLLAKLDEISSGRVFEVKGRELYRGNAFWRKFDGGERTRLIDQIIKWMIARKHAVTFGAVSKPLLRNRQVERKKIGLEEANEWSIAAFHLLLGIQKKFQGLKNNKGNCVFVFDSGTEYKCFSELVVHPPRATEGFYGRQEKERPLNQVIDVPFFADSRHVGLIQVADLFAYIFRLYSDLAEGVTQQRFEGEFERLEGWIENMRPVLLPDSARWPKSSTDPCTRFLRSIAPPSLLRVKT